MTAAAQLVMPFAPAVSYRSEDFLHGGANEIALSLLERWPDWPYAIVLITGPKGSGKTHLAHLFARHAKAGLIDAERVGKQTADQLLAGNHCWVLDGIERVSSESALAQLINHARARGDYLLLTSRDVPQPKLPDLASRLRAMPSVSLGLPDDALLAGVLAKAFADRQIRVSPDILSYAVSRLERSYAAVQQLAAKLDEASLAHGRKISLNLVRQLVG